MLGHGLGTEVTRLVLAHAFDDLGLSELTVRVLEFNSRAIGCYARCGFSPLRREPDAVTLDGVSYADEIMHLEADDYRRLAADVGRLAEYSVVAGDARAAVRRDARPVRRRSRHERVRTDASGDPVKTGGRIPGVPIRVGRRWLAGTPRLSASVMSGANEGSRNKRRPWLWALAWVGGFVAVIAVLILILR